MCAVLNNIIFRTEVDSDSDSEYFPAGLLHFEDRSPIYTRSPN